MSEEFGNHFVRKPAQPGAPTGGGLPSRPVILPPKRAVPAPEPEPEPEPAAEPAAPEPQKPQVKPGPIRVEFKKPAAQPAQPPAATAPAAPVAQPAPAPVAAKGATGIPAIRRLAAKPTYSKIFRWQLPEGQPTPALVEVAGTFNHWQKVPLAHEGATDIWQATVANIAGHRPHHYMIFVDGKPANDSNAEGLAVPHGQHEEQAAFTTPRGPRVFMFASQAK